jgi:hypothetical protein
MWNQAHRPFSELARRARHAGTGTLRNEIAYVAAAADPNLRICSGCAASSRLRILE